MGLLVQVRARADGVLAIVAPKAMPPEPVRELDPLGNWRFAQKGVAGDGIEIHARCCRQRHWPDVARLVQECAQGTHRRPARRSRRARVDTGGDAATRQRTCRRVCRNSIARARAIALYASDAYTAERCRASRRSRHCRVQIVVHRGTLGFSLDIPAGWTVRGTGERIPGKSGNW